MNGLSLTRAEANANPAIRKALEAQEGKAKKRSKYGNVPTYVDGVRFDSKREARFYSDLVVAQRAGLVKWFARQCRFVIEGGECVVDFIVVMADGTVRVVDPKGHRTKMYRRSKKQVQQRYGVEIEEV